MNNENYQRRTGGTAGICPRTNGDITRPANSPLFLNSRVKFYPPKPKLKGLEKYFSEIKRELQFDSIHHFLYLRVMNCTLTLVFECMRARSI